MRDGLGGDDSASVGLFQVSPASLGRAALPLIGTFPGAAYCYGWEVASDPRLDANAHLALPKYIKEGTGPQVHIQASLLGWL